MEMQTLPVTFDHPRLRLLGRMDREQRVPALDWTGSGLEVQLRGTDIWAELEAPALSPIMWMVVLADGCPITRFPVEPGIRFYPLLLGMEAEKTRTVTLLKETQCMPDQPEATVRLHSIRFRGELEELPLQNLKIEFIGDSLTSGEGTLAARGNEEWITPWFSSVANYSNVACQELNAERRVLSQSGWGVCWGWDHNESSTMAAGYDRIVGVLKGPEAEARGCGKAYDFSAWVPDIICVRLLTNDCGGMNIQHSFEADQYKVVQGSLAFLRRIRSFNPSSRIVWILPSTDCHPELGRKAVLLAAKEGMQNVYFCTLPDYGPEDMGARSHPNAAFNRRAGHLLAGDLRTIL